MKMLPWASVSGPKYFAKELKPHKKWVRIGCWMMSFLLIIGGIITPYRVATVFGLLYILVLLMKKDTAVTTRGLEVFYQMQITTQYDFWGWEQILGVTREDRGHPELVALHFAYGNRSKRLFFTKADAEEIMKLAKTQNPDIIVGDAAKSQMIGATQKRASKKKR